MIKSGNRTSVSCVQTLNTGAFEIITLNENKDCVNTQQVEVLK